MAQMLSCLCYWHWYSGGAGVSRRIAIDTDPAHGLAEAFCIMVFQEAWLRDNTAEMRALKIRTVDAAFTLYAEHDFA